MTEGAKTGTPYHCEIYAQDLQDPHCLVGPDGVICRIGCQEDATFMRDLEPVMSELNRMHATLIEALKVAGEALEGIKWTAGSQGDARTLYSALLMVQERAIEALAALERIRNNKH